MQILINTIVYFSTYLSVACSFYFLYQTTKFIKISHSFTITFGAYIFYEFIIKNNFPLTTSLLFIIFSIISLGILYGYLIICVKKLRLNFLTFFVFSLGLYVILQNLISLYFGDETKTLNTGEITVGHQFFGAYITTVQIITIIVAFAVFIGMYFLYNYTLLGKQIRAVSENSELAGIYGISSNKIILIVTAVSSALAAIAGILYAYDTNLTPTMGFNLLLYGIVAMIIGGVGSFRGLLFGSLLLATAQNLVAYYLDTKWMDAATYIILIAFLLWKPLGFSGKKLKKVEI